MTTKTIGPTVLISERRMGHNQSDIHEHDAIDSLTSGWALGEFNPQDYPVLVWLISNIGYAFTPYKIWNRDEFIATLKAVGYELIDSWSYNRTCSIPFHPDRFVNAYHGMYFRLGSVNQP